MFLVVGVEGEDETLILREVVNEFGAPGIEPEITIRLPKTFALAMIVVAEITERPARAVDRGVASEKVVAAIDVLGREVERRIRPRQVGDKINRTAWLRPELERGPAADDLDPLERVERRRVMRLWETELLVLDRDPVLQDLTELAPLRIETAIPDIDDRRGRLFADE